jgi:hypothetical protein
MSLYFFLEFLEFHQKVWFHLQFLHLHPTPDWCVDTQRNENEMNASVNQWRRNWNNPNLKHLNNWGVVQQHSSNQTLCWQIAQTIFNLRTMF